MTVGCKNLLQCPVRTLILKNLKKSASKPNTLKISDTHSYRFSDTNTAMLPKAVALPLHSLAARSGLLPQCYHKHVSLPG